MSYDKAHYAGGEIDPWEVKGFSQHPSGAAGTHSPPSVSSQVSCSFLSFLTAGRTGLEKRQIYCSRVIKWLGIGKEPRGRWDQEFVRDSVFLPDPFVSFKEIWPENTQEFLGLHCCSKSLWSEGSTGHRNLRDFHCADWPFREWEQAPKAAMLGTTLQLARWSQVLASRG